MLRKWFGLDRYESWISLEMMRLMRLLIEGAVGLTMLFLMLVVTSLEFAGVGILFLWSYIAASSLPSLVWWSIMVILLELHPDPIVCSAGALPKRRRLVRAVRHYAVLPGPAFIWTSDWVSLPPSADTAEDVNVWPYSVGILIKWVAFSGTLHWPAAGADQAVGGVSFVGILSCMSFGLGRGLSWGELFRGIVDQVAQFQCRLFLLVQALIFGQPVVSLGWYR